jgi:hypothetical protein
VTKEHCPIRLAGIPQPPHLPCDRGDFSRDNDRRIRAEESEVNHSEFEEIAQCLESAAKALERAQELAAAAKERALAGAIAGAAGVVGDLIDELNETSIHE